MDPWIHGSDARAAARAAAGAASSAATVCTYYVIIAPPLYLHDKVHTVAAEAAAPAAAPAADPWIHGSTSFIMNHSFFFFFFFFLFLFFCYEMKSTFTGSSQCAKEPNPGPAAKQCVLSICLIKLPHGRLIGSKYITTGADLYLSENDRRRRWRRVEEFFEHFRLFRSFIFFRNRSCRCDSIGPKIVEIGAILASRFSGRLKIFRSGRTFGRYKLHDLLLIIFTDSHFKD